MLTFSLVKAVVIFTVSLKVKVKVTLYQATKGLEEE
jgi:hypothetical protein